MSDVDELLDRLPPELAERGNLGVGGGA